VSTVPVLCIVRAAAIDGLESATLGPALDLEAMKAGLALAHREAESRDDCLPTTDDRLVLLVGEGPAVVVFGPSGTAWPVDLGGLEIPDRAQDVARRVVALFRRPGRESGLSLVMEGLPRWPAPPAPTPTAAWSAPGPRRVQGYVVLAGAWRYENAAGLHSGTAGLEAGASLYQERLQAGIGLAWQPARSMRRDPFDVRVDGVELFGRVRGGLALGPALLRAGVGVGAQWRRLRVKVPSRTDVLGATAWVPLAGGEVEAAFRVGSIFRIGLATIVTGCLSWTDYRYRGRDVYPGPRFAVDVALRLGAVFPGRPQ